MEGHSALQTAIIEVLEPWLEYNFHTFDEIEIGAVFEGFRETYPEIFNLQESDLKTALRISVNQQLKEVSQRLHKVIDKLEIGAMG